MAPESATVRLRSIDFLRGLAALIVAFGHAVVAAPYSEIAGRWFEQLCLNIMWVAVSGVALFFVVSGFCIHLGQARHGEEGFRFGAFWRRRIWRLYPTYFVVLCGSMALLLVHWRFGTGQELLAPYPEPRGTWLAADFWMHALMLHGLHPFFDQAAGNPPLWTLAREEYLYLMYPLLLVAVRRWSWITVAALLACITIAIDLVPPAAPRWELILIRSAPALWIQWHLGVVAADAYRGKITLPVFWRQTRWVPMWILMAYFLPFSAIWLGLGYFTALNACVGVEMEGRWPERGLVDAIARVGLWSYSLYLVHHPVQTVSLAVTRLVVQDVGVAGFTMRALLLVVISCVAGRVLFALVERHFVSIRRASRHAPVPGALTQRREAPAVQP